LLRLTTTRKTESHKIRTERDSLLIPRVRERM
jgi:hypothetical protein